MGTQTQYTSLCIEATAVGNEDVQTVDTNIDLFQLIQDITESFQRNKKNQIKNLVRKYAILKKSDQLGSVQANECDWNLESPEFKAEFKTFLKTTLLRRCYEKRETNDNDLLFLAAGIPNLDNLQQLITTHTNNDFLKQAKCTNSVVMFTLKYGNTQDENFFKCMELLVGSGVDINKPDFRGRFAADYIPILHEENKNYPQTQSVLKQIMSLFLKEGISRNVSGNTKKFLNENNLQTNNSTYVDLVPENQLFYWITKNKIEDISNFENVGQYVNHDNGEYTLLQFALKKFNKKAALFLLDNGADPTKSSIFNPTTFSDFTLVMKDKEIFQKIIDHPNVIITQEMFNKLANSLHVKTFKALLESNKLDPSFTYEKTKNTPLHYAILFSHKEIIHKLLKGSRIPLNIENKFGKCPLDMINRYDFENYLDYCLALDGHNTNFYSNEYKMQLRFKSLIVEDNKNNADEIKIISKIAENKNLQHLLTHPLIFTFIDLKWTKAQVYYVIILITQFILFLLLSISFSFLSGSPTSFIFPSVIFTINFVIKIFICFGNITFLFLSRFKLHYGVWEVILILLLLLGFPCLVCRVFSLVWMSILLLLTAGYHPRIAKWSVMLQTVFKTFTILFCFFSVIILAFAASFHILFKQTNHKFFDSFWKSLFITYVMTTGEFNTGEVKFSQEDVGGYVLFLLFTIFLSLFIVNFFVGAAVTDIGKIEKDAEINALKEVIAFLQFIEIHICAKKLFKRYLRLPILFPKKLEGQNYNVDFYVNRKNQFEGQEKFPERVGKECLDKIEQYYLNKTMNLNDNGKK